MMLESDTGFTRESLAKAIVDRFGEDARFHSCSQSGMNADAVIDFLEQRGKFVIQGNGFNTSAEKICNH
jgi:probable metal-binding protein